MAKTSLPPIFILCLFLGLSLSFPMLALAGTELVENRALGIVSSQCNGTSIGGECFENDVQRRNLLVPTLYISYGALLANRVPCDQRGSSYYNCSPNENNTANPYTRGCSQITRCAR